MAENVTAAQVAGYLRENGEAVNRGDSDFDPVQLSAGTMVELEHGYDFDVAKEIAKDHLVEDPEYYSDDLFSEDIEERLEDLNTQAEEIPNLEEEEETLSGELPVLETEEESVEEIPEEIQASFRSSRVFLKSNRVLDYALNLGEVASPVAMIGEDGRILANRAGALNFVQKVLDTLEGYNNMVPKLMVLRANLEHDDFNGAYLVNLKDGHYKQLTDVEVENYIAEESPNFITSSKKKDKDPKNYNGINVTGFDLANPQRVSQTLPQPEALMASWQPVDTLYSRLVLLAPNKKMISSSLSGKLPGRLYNHYFELNPNGNREAIKPSVDKDTKIIFKTPYGLRSVLELEVMDSGFVILDMRDELGMFSQFDIGDFIPNNKMMYLIGVQALRDKQMESTDIEEEDEIETLFASRTPNLKAKSPVNSAHSWAIYKKNEDGSRKFVTTTDDFFEMSQYYRPPYEIEDINSSRTLISSELMDEASKYTSANDLSTFLTNQGYEARENGEYIEFGKPQQPAELRVAKDSDGSVISIQAVNSALKEGGKLIKGYVDGHSGWDYHTEDGDYWLRRSPSISGGYDVKDAWGHYQWFRTAAEARKYIRDKYTIYSSKSVNSAMRLNPDFTPVFDRSLIHELKSILSPERVKELTEHLKHIWNLPAHFNWNEVWEALGDETFYNELMMNLTIAEQSAFYQHYENIMSSRQPIQSMSKMAGGPKQSEFKKPDGSPDREAYLAAYYKWKADQGFNVPAKYRVKTNSQQAVNYLAPENIEKLKEYFLDLCRSSSWGGVNGYATQLPAAFNWTPRKDNSNSAYGVNNISFWSNPESYEYGEIDVDSDNSDYRGNTQFKPTFNKLADLEKLNSIIAEVEGHELRTLSKDEARRVAYRFFEQIYDEGSTRDFYYVKGEMGGDLRSIRVYYRGGMVIED